MGNLDFSANADQLKELAAYMASQINVPTIGIGGGYAPIGTIIPLMGTTAPQDYLACDGTVYNIADYPQLADYFESQFGESNHFGGDGTTTFAVPDLQGEFLRGTGTNSHANQGSGANVGEHQDGTYVPCFSFNGSTLQLNSSGNTQYISAMNADSVIDRVKSATANTTVTPDSGPYGPYTSRPTNTSVLYCIKAVVAGEVYSTEERVVGTWIDGKKLYQKVIVLNERVFASGSWPTFCSVSNMNIDNYISGIFIESNTIAPIGSTISNGNLIIYYPIANTFAAKTAIIQYTKTTD